MEKIDMKPDFVFSPQPMYIIGTRNEDETPNFCIITWIGFSFDKTPHLMMTIGGSKQTKTNILRENMFSANLISEDNLWLADYFGTTRAEDKIKNDIAYNFNWGKYLNVPVLEQSKWVYECEVSRVIELDGAHLFLADIKNIQIDKNLIGMDLEMIDLNKLKPAIYAPYNYFSVGERIGGCGEWKYNLLNNNEEQETIKVRAN
ncbi:MAG: flavin reductase family protein [Anaerocolumna sp.]|jgi:flavin reductase (DIM6/NTAB) family NADH-FMN oxidoreductase RutF|nr:flavin reductase family protein [Anaerocolumna sp.]